jgi:hypothetical protein
MSSVSTRKYDIFCVGVKPNKKEEGCDILVS